MVVLPLRKEPVMRELNCVQSSLPCVVAVDFGTRFSTVWPDGEDDDCRMKPLLQKRLENGGAVGESP